MHGFVYFPFPAIMGNVPAVCRFRQRLRIEEYEIQLFPSAQIMAALKGLCIQHVVTVHKIYVFAGGVQQSPVARDG
jgi:hypothetical protein